MPLTQAVTLGQEGKLRDAKTVAGILAAAQRRT